LLLHYGNYSSRKVSRKITREGIVSAMQSNGLLTKSTPMPKVYKALPPSLPELDEVLAFVYLGPTCPTEKEFKRIPLLVRRNKVAMALEWLKLNHIDYTDLNISYENLNSYPENEPPVQVDYHYKEVTEQAENSAVTEIEPDNAVSDGECPFIVHGLTGIQIESQSAKAL